MLFFLNTAVVPLLLYSYTRKVVVCWFVFTFDVLAVLAHPIGGAFLGHKLHTQQGLIYEYTRRKKVLPTYPENKIPVYRCILRLYTRTVVHH